MSAEQEGRAAAELFRRTHGLGNQPLGDLVALIEQTTGIDVAVLDVEPNEHGLTMRDPHRGVVFIAVARTRHPMRQRSTLAHELAHVVLEDWGSGESPSREGERPTSEVRADAFARHLLVPVTGIQDVLDRGRPVDLASLSRVVQRFEVSPAMATIAMHAAGAIDSTAKERWRGLGTPQLAARFGWADQYESLQVRSDRARAPQKLVARAIAGYVENVVGAQTIATLRGRNVDDVVRDLRDQGIEPRADDIDWADADSLPEIGGLPDVDGVGGRDS